MTQTGQSGSLQPGAAIGEFRVVELLGRGGMGEVYRAEQTSLRRQDLCRFRHTLDRWLAHRYSCRGRDGRAAEILTWAT